MNNVKHLLYAAHHHLVHKEYDLATPLIEAALQQAPDDSDCHVQAGYLHLEQGDRDKAASFFFKAVELAPHSSKPFFALARYYSVIGDDALKVQSYQQAVSAEVSKESEAAKAELCLNDQKYAQAIPHFRKAKELGHGSAGSHTSLPYSYWDTYTDTKIGGTLFQMGAYDDARRVLRHVVQETSAPHPGAWYYLGMSEVKLKNWNGALFPLQQAVREAPDDYSAHLWLGRMQLRLGHFRSLWHTFHTLLSLSPGSTASNQKTLL